MAQLDSTCSINADFIVKGVTVLNPVGQHLVPSLSFGDPQTQVLIKIGEKYSLQIGTLDYASASAFTVGDAGAAPIQISLDLELSTSSLETHHGPKFLPYSPRQSDKQERQLTTDSPTETDNSTLDEIDIANSDAELDNDAKVCAMQQLAASCPLQPSKLDDSRISHGEEGSESSDHDTNQDNSSIDKHNDSVSSLDEELVHTSETSGSQELATHRVVQDHAFFVERDVSSHDTDNTPQSLDSLEEAILQSHTSENPESVTSNPLRRQDVFADCATISQEILDLVQYATTNWHQFFEGQLSEAVIHQEFQNFLADKPSPLDEVLMFEAINVLVADRSDVLALRQSECMREGFSFAALDPDLRLIIMPWFERTEWTLVLVSLQSFKIVFIPEENDQLGELLLEKVMACLSTKPWALAYSGLSLKPDFEGTGFMHELALLAEVELILGSEVEYIPNSGTVLKLRILRKLIQPVRGRAIAKETLEDMQRDVEQRELSVSNFVRPFERLGHANNDMIEHLTFTLASSHVFADLAVMRQSLWVAPSGSMVDLAMGVYNRHQAASLHSVIRQNYASMLVYDRFRYLEQSYQAEMHRNRNLRKRVKVNGDAVKAGRAGYKADAYAFHHLLREWLEHCMIENIEPLQVQCELGEGQSDCMRQLKDVVNQGKRMFSPLGSLTDPFREPLWLLIPCRPIQSMLSPDVLVTPEMYHKLNTTDVQALLRLIRTKRPQLWARLNDLFQGLLTIIRGKKVALNIDSMDQEILLKASLDSDTLLHCLDRRSP